LNDGTVVLELSPGAGRALVEKLNETVQGFQGDPHDFNNSMVAGDPVSLLKTHEPLDRLQLCRPPVKR
jgi:hypothetical protein